MSAIGEVWDPLGPMPEGLTVLEASAGTGKTWTIEALVVRLVAELGLGVDELLVVTYTRAATAELDGRIRSRLRGALVGLEEGASASSDPVVARLQDQPAPVREQARARLRTALDRYDQATISTIHGFCQRMLQQHAFESGAGFDLELVEDTEDLIAEAAIDVYQRWTHTASPAEVEALHGLGLDPDGARRLVGAAVADPDRRLDPDPEAPQPDVAAEVAALASAWPEHTASLVASVEEAKAAGRFRKGQRTYNASGARKHAAAIGAWLEAGAGGGLPRTTATWVSADGRQGKAADGESVWSHPAFEAVEALLALRANEGSVRRARFAAEGRDRFEALKDRARVMAFQDLLRGLAARLGPSADPDAREALAQAIRGVYKAALIDEFQDTDQHQWTVFQAVFDHPGHRLYLIGDPKQAIYGFRGANVHVYRNAVTSPAARRFTMKVNHRSDQVALDAANAWLDRPGLFGDVGFAYVGVKAPSRDPSVRIRQGDGEPPANPPLVFRHLGSPDGEPLNKGEATTRIVAETARDVTRLLQAGEQVFDEDAGGWRRIRPGDVAVLVRTGAQARDIQAALGAWDVPAVLSGADSVLASDEAEMLSAWLDALARPTGASARRAASTAWFGWTASQLAAVSREDPDVVEAWDAWLGRLRQWREVLRRDGLHRAVRQAMHDTGAWGRLLAMPGGARRVTNLMHVTELVHGFAHERRAGLDAMRRWLAARRADEALARDVRELRLERDDDAVQIMTVHKAKGLTVRVCFVPFAWSVRLKPVTPGEVVRPDPDHPDREWLHVGIDRSSSATAEALAQRAREEAEEAVRLLYVALTRARHRTVVYVAEAKGVESSALAWALAGDDPAGPVAGVPRDALSPALAALASRAPAGTIGVQRVGEEPEPSAWRATTATPVLPDPAPWRGRVDRVWRRHSYSALARAVHREEVVAADAPDRDDPSLRDPRVPTASVDPVPQGPPVPLSGMPGGAEAGTALHAIMEHLDFEAVDADPACADPVVREHLIRGGFDADRWAPEVARGLVAAVRTPLGGPLGDLRLADVPRSRRWDELRFDLPVAGASAAERLDVGRVVDVLSDRVEDGALPGSWVEALGALRGKPIAGFLTGAIDLILQDPAGRWWVVDHKSNKVAPRADGSLGVEAFTPDALQGEMATHHYFLQYHLYLVALHRYLRWRLPDYDPAQHLGGAAYLFLRGMTGPEAPRYGGAVSGVVVDPVPAEVVERLDRVFEGAS